MYIVLDTNTFIRGITGGIYRPLIQKIEKKCDIIAATKRIIKEYKGASYMFLRNLLRMIEDLRRIKKFEIIPQSKVDATIKRILKPERMRLPSHHKDYKFIYLAWVLRARCIISNDPDLTCLHPYNFQGVQFGIFRPEKYS